MLCMKHNGCIASSYSQDKNGLNTNTNDASSHLAIAIAIGTVANSYKV